MIVLGVKLAKPSGFYGVWYVLEGEQNQGHLQAKATLWAVAQQWDRASLSRLNGIRGREF